MIALLLATTLDLHPFDLVRVDDPNHPDADARSATGAVLLGIPDEDIAWRDESVPHLDSFPGPEALEAMNVSHWHDRGVTGAGVKVAIFDLAWYGAEFDPEEVGFASSHDCYTHSSCDVPMDHWYPRFKYEEGAHGIACTEVIHDIAPDAMLYMVRVNGQTALENAVDWAIREEIDLISMSMSFFNTSFYDGTGPISRWMERLAANGVLMVTSAGNYAQQHWKGPFSDIDGDGRMDFGGDNRLQLSLRTGKNRGVYINWNEHGYCGITDLDAVMRDLDDNVLGRSETVQDASAKSCSPVERLTGYVEEDGLYWLEVYGDRISQVALDVDVFVTSGSIVGAMPEGSITDPGTHPMVFTVGAVNADGYLYNDIEPFSSWGPTHAGVFKPDIAGPDGLSTAAYGSEGFYGTSAATPAVTGALALLMSEDLDRTPFDAADLLRAHALSDDVLFSQPDPRWGAGKARLPVFGEGPTPCGRRPLWAAMILWPVVGFRRRREACTRVLNGSSLDRIGG